MLASGGMFGESKARKRCVLTFVDRQPRNRRSWKKMPTSLTLSRAAKIKDMMRFRRASLYASQSGICDPVTMTGLPRFSSMNASADATYAIVSVPVTTTNPSKSM